MQRILILDLNYHLNRAVHVEALNELRDANGHKTGGVFGLLNTVQVCLNRCNASKCIGVWDGGRSPRRLALYPPDPAKKVGYKVARGILPDMTAEEKAEKEQTKQDIATGQWLSNPVLMDAGVHVVRWPEREADDVIGVLARTLAGQHCEHVIIGSDDWDFAQTVDERVVLFRPMKDEWITLQNFMEKVGVPIDWACVKKAAQGDDGDSIPGVKGVGPETIAKAVRSYIVSVVPTFQSSQYDEHWYRNTCPADLTPFFDFCGAQKAAKIKLISAGRDVILRNMELIDLKREVFPDEHVADLLKSVMTPRRFDEMTVIAALGRMNIQSHLENFAHWSEPFRRIS